MERQSGGKRADLRIARLEVEGDELVVFSWTPGSSPPVAPNGLASALTTAERAVYALLVIGLSDADIAALRGTTRSTITKQVDAIFRKVGVRSRRELIARHSDASGEDASTRDASSGDASRASDGDQSTQRA